MGNAQRSTVDRSGRIVSVGSMVKVLAIKDSILDRLSSKDVNVVLSMRGNVFEVYEIDDWGSAWVRKEWRHGRDRMFSHSVALSPGDMERID